MPELADRLAKVTKGTEDKKSAEDTEKGLLNPKKSCKFELEKSRLPVELNSV